jgi:hypothetical protein
MAGPAATTGTGLASEEDGTFTAMSPVLPPSSAPGTPRPVLPQRLGNAKAPSGSHRPTIGTGHVREPPFWAAVQSGVGRLAAVQI